MLNPLSEGEGRPVELGVLSVGEKVELSQGVEGLVIVLGERVPEYIGDMGGVILVLILVKDIGEAGGGVSRGLVSSEDIVIVENMV